MGTEFSYNYNIPRLTNGWAINLDDIVIAFRWVSSVSYLKYGYEAMCVNEFKGLRFTCTADQLIYGICPITRGEQVLSTLAMEDASLERSFLFLGGFLIVMNILFLLLITFKSQFPK